MRLIDADKAISDYAYYGISHSYDAYDLKDILTECPTIEAIPKADYEARLKADMVAMLTEIQLEIEELKETERSFCHHFERGLRLSSDIIQQKIDSLKAESEDKE